MAMIRDLREAVENAAAIDAHCHNLVAMDSSFPFLRCFSEAEGEALTNTPHTLSFKRSIRDIAGLYSCGATLSDVENHRNSSGLHTIASKCFDAANISTIFIDDGIEFDKKQEWGWHSCFVPAVGRIIGIETLAETVINQEMQRDSKITLESFTELFLTKLKSNIIHCVAMKSIVAYRSGLEIDTHVSKMSAEAGLLEEFNAKKPVHIRNKNLLDYIFTCSLEVALHFNLPMQMHTGFGEKELDLKKCNPLLLRGVLEDKQFSGCRLVLLHAPYPFSKQASYLASVYSQVYLDFGLAIPKLSVRGMKSSIQELLELAPINKVLFSSGGYAFPETFYLGAKRSREVIYSVLLDACNDGDLTISEAIEAVERIFQRNALNIYNFEKVITSDGNDHSLKIGSTLLDRQQENIVFVRLVWVDNSGQQKCRVVPMKHFYEITKNNGIGLTVASMSMTSYSSCPAKNTNLTAVGEIRIIPDMSTKHRIPWSEHEEMVMVDMHITPGVTWECCPRSSLLKVSKILREEFNLVMNVGFEIEFYLLKNTSREEVEQFVPFDSSSYSSSSGFDIASPIMQEMVSCLHSMGIFVEQLHAEVGPGQFEIVLRHTQCTKSADNLIFVREAIRGIARKHGLLATFLPKYSTNYIASGCHAHLSLSENGKNIFMTSDLSEAKYGISKIGQKFMAGVFHHLPSILAITAPIPNSYDRIQPDAWSGAYHFWGRENKEAPLRAACPPGISSGFTSNFEFKSIDGCANPYLSLASIVASGIDGLRRNLILPEPIDVVLSNLEVVPKRLPTDLSQSVAALENNCILNEFLGEKLMTAILGVRKAEIEYYAKNKFEAEKLIHIY